MSKAKRRRDWLWLLAYPIYQTIGTIRHELGHALVALAMGGQITEFVFFPGFRNGQLYFGYVRYTGASHWLITAGPYLLDLLTFLVFFAICMQLPFKRRWLWLNLVIFGIVSPLVNSAYQYLKPLWGSYGDVHNLFSELPGGLLHLYFILTITLYLAGLALVFRRSRHSTSQGAFNE
jgi:hypothetical protein